MTHGRYCNIFTHRMNKKVHNNRSRVYMEIFMIYHIVFKTQIDASAWRCGIWFPKRSLKRIDCEKVSENFIFVNTKRYFLYRIRRYIYIHLGEWSDEANDVNLLPLREYIKVFSFVVCRAFIIKYTLIYYN